MRKILLTSTGFDNDNIKNKFLSLLNKNISEVKVLFVITAAQDPGAFPFQDSGLKHCLSSHHLPVCIRT